MQKFVYRKLCYLFYERPVTSFWFDNMKLFENGSQNEPNSILKLLRISTTLYTKLLSIFYFYRLALPFKCPTFLCSSSTWNGFSLLDSQEFRATFRFPVQEPELLQSSTPEDREPNFELDNTFEGLSLRKNQIKMEWGQGNKSPNFLNLLL